MRPFRRASCDLVLASSQSAVSSCCCLFDNLGHSSGHLVSSRVGLSWTNVQHVYPSGSLMLKIWKRVVPIHSIALRERRCSLVIPTIFQRVLGGVFDECSRLPHDIDIC